MSELLLPIGGSGGTSSDELSATKANVLSGKTAVTKDSDDEAVVGTMPDNSTTTSNGTVPGINSSYPNVPTREGENLQYNVDTNGVKRINMEPPKGYYPGGGGSYIDRPASDFGDAAASQVLSGVRFTSENGLNIQGSIADRGTNQYGNFGEGSDYYAINGLPEGHYKSNGFSWAPEARISKTALRNALGIRANIIRSGYSIAGVAGTLSVQSAISFSAAAISYNTIRISWKNPARGPWQGVFIQMSTSGNPGTGGGSRAYTGRGNSSSANASNYVDITGLNANTTYYFTCTSYVDNLGWGTSYNVNCKTKAISPIQAFDLVGLYPGTSYGYRRYGDSSAYECSYHQFTNGILICGGEEPYEDGEAYWRKSSLDYGATNDTVSIDLRFSGSVRDDESTVNKLISYLTPALVGKTVRIGGASYNRNSTNVRKMDADLYSTAKIASLGKSNWGTNGKWRPYNLTIQFSNTSYTFGSSFSMDFNV